MVEMATPRTLMEALEIRKNYQVIPFAGGTDLMVRRKAWAGTLPRFEYPALFIGDIAELKGIQITDGILTIGATATLAAIMEYETTPEILKQAIAEMASPAVRNAGTLGGNLCNASPAADTLPPLYALGASLILQNLSGRREIPVAEYIQGPGKTDLKEDELLVAVNIPVDRYNIIYYKKVGTRKADALSKVSFAGLARTVNGVVEDIRITLGAVAPRVVRSLETESLIKGKKVSDLPKLISEIKKNYEQQIRPIDDQRSNAAYRSMVAYRLIEYFIAHLV
jgi:CO/xanthine dehydrogenase FAD-binding subunit